MPFVIPPPPSIPPQLNPQSVLLSPAEAFARTLAEMELAEALGCSLEHLYTSPLDRP